MKTIRINGPGDGQWIMDQVGGFFTPDYDHSFVSVREGAKLGGFACCAYLGASMTVHMAGVDPRWCSRDLLWMVFDYAFMQLGLRKLIAPVRSNNLVALAQDLRAGFRVEAVVRDAYPDADMILLTMDRGSCRWLDIRPTGYKSFQN